MLLAEPEAPGAARELVVTGTILWADIRGFTALSEQYVDQGPEATEQLRSRINAVFSAIVDAVDAAGGDVLLFAGDGVLALFERAPSEVAGAAAIRAARCSLDLQAAGGRVQDADIEVHVGLASGEVRTSLIGGVDEQWHVLASGRPLIDAKVAESRASRDRVVLAPSTVEALGGHAVAEVDDDGFGVLGSVQEAEHPVRGAARPELDDDLARLLVLPGLGEAPELDRWRAETRQVTAVFVDVCDIGPDPGLAELHALFHPLQRAFVRCGAVITGVSFEAGGLTVLGVFGLPMSSHEDDARRALRSSEAIRSSFQGSAHRVAIGVATGQVLCGTMGSARRRDYTMIGNTVNLAARLMQGALSRQPPDGGKPTIWCDSYTYRRAAGAFLFSPLPPLPVQGRSTRIPLYRVGGAAAPDRASRSRTGRMVGRERELAALGGVARRVAEGERAHLRVTGAAGTGKSLLLRELGNRLQTAGVMSFTGQGDAVESSEPYRPLQPIFDEIFGLDPDTDGSSGLWLVEAWLSDHTPSLLSRIPLVGVVTSFGIADNEETAALQGKVRADETQAVLVEVLRRATAGVPTMLVLEDAHWFDSATWAVLGRVLAELPNVSLAVSTRPPDTETAGAGSSSLDSLLDGEDVTELDLEALAARDVAALAGDELGVDELPADVAEYLAGRSGGNPFYVIELTRALRETGGLELADGVCRVADPSGSLPPALLPSSLHAVVVSRIDRLSTLQSLALKVASVLGLDFSLELLADVLPVPLPRERLRDDLDAVAALNLLRPSETADGYYSFDHALTRDVVASLLLTSQRRDLHRSVAERLEQDADLANAATIAHHWTMSTAAGGDLDSAIAMTSWARRAAVMHLRENALLEAAVTLESALLALDAVAPGTMRDALELQLQVLRAVPLMLTGGWASSQVIAAYRRAQELCTAIGPGPELFPTLAGVFTFLLVSGSLDEAYAMALANDAIARGSGDSAVTAEGAHDRLTSSFYVGRLADTVACFDALEAAYRPEDHPLHTQMYGKNPYATGLGHVAMALALQGRTDEALRRAQQALDHTVEFVDPFSNVWAMTILAIVRQLRDEPAEMVPIAADMIRVCEQHGYPWIAQALAWSGWSGARAGRVAEGIAGIEQGLAIWEMTGSRIMTTYLRALLADALLVAGDPARAREVVDTGLADARSTGEVAWQPLLLKARGDVAAAAGEGRLESARWYREAVALGLELGAGLVVLRALLGLAELGALTSEESETGVALLDSLPELASLALFDGARPRLAPAARALDEGIVL